MPDFGPVVDNLRYAMRGFARATGRGETREMPGLTIASAGMDAAIFNAALLAPPTVGDANEFDRRVLSAAVHFSVRGLAWSFWLCEDLLESGLRRKGERMLAARGLRHISSCPGMIAGELKPAAGGWPELDLRPVDRGDGRLAFCHIMSTTFELSFETARAIYGSEALWSEGFRGWIGYVEGNAVTTAVTVPAAGVVGVYAVATLPAWRRRGYAEAITRHAVTEARQASGFERSVLQSTASGLPLYRKLGYREVTRILVYRGR